MQQRDKTFRKYCNSKQTMTKGKLYGDFKNLKNQVIFLTCKLKSYFCKTFFENNKNNTTNIWTKIKQLITLKASNRRNLNFTSSYEKLIINSKILLLFLMITLLIQGRLYLDKSKKLVFFSLISKMITLLIFYF